MRKPTRRRGPRRPAPDAWPTLVGAGVQELRLEHLAVDGVPGSGTGDELLAWAGIDADHIAAAARVLART